MYFVILYYLIDIDYLYLQVRGVFVDTRHHGPGPAISGVLPRHRPLLHKLRAKDPVSLENAGHVSTRTYSLFLCYRFWDRF